MVESINRKNISMQKSKRWDLGGSRLVGWICLFASPFSNQNCILILFLYVTHTLFSGSFMLK